MARWLILWREWSALWLVEDSTISIAAINCTSTQETTSPKSEELDFS